MFILKNHYQEVVQLDLIFSNPVAKLQAIPQLENIVLSIGGDDSKEEKVFSSLCLLELVGEQKPYLTRTKVSSTSKPLSKGSVVGGKVYLRKNSMYSFLHKFLFEFLPNLRQFEALPPFKHKNLLTFSIHDLFVFESLSFFFSLFDESGILHINFSFNSKNISDSIFLSRSLQFCIRDNK
ncbi:unnamed protein product [Discosporangium mesarthrocarpum]